MRVKRSIESDYQGDKVIRSVVSCLGDLGGTVRAAQVPLGVRLELE